MMFETIWVRNPISVYARQCTISIIISVCLIVNSEDVSSCTFEYPTSTVADFFSSGGDLYKSYGVELKDVEVYKPITLNSASLMILSDWDTLKSEFGYGKNSKVLAAIRPTSNNDTYLLFLHTFSGTESEYDIILEPPVLYIQIYKDATIAWLHLKTDTLYNTTVKIKSTADATGTYKQYVTSIVNLHSTVNNDADITVKNTRSLNTTETVDIYATDTDTICHIFNGSDYIFEIGVPFFKRGEPFNLYTNIPTACGYGNVGYILQNYTACKGFAWYCIPFTDECIFYQLFDMENTNQDTAGVFVNAINKIYYTFTSNYTSAGRNAAPVKMQAGVYLPSSIKHTLPKFPMGSKTEYKTRHSIKTRVETTLYTTGILGGYTFSGIFLWQDTGTETNAIIYLCNRVSDDGNVVESFVLSFPSAQSTMIVSPVHLLASSVYTSGSLSTNIAYSALEPIHVVTILSKSADNDANVQDIVYIDILFGTCSSKTVCGGFSQLDLIGGKTVSCVSDESGGCADNTNELGPQYVSTVNSHSFFIADDGVLYVSQWDYCTSTVTSGIYLDGALITHGPYSKFQVNDTEKALFISKTYIPINLIEATAGKTLRVPIIAYATNYTLNVLFPDYSSFPSTTACASTDDKFVSASVPTTSADGAIKFFIWYDFYSSTFSTGIFAIYIYTQFIVIDLYEITTGPTITFKASHTLPYTLDDGILDASITDSVLLVLSLRGMVLAYALTEYIVYTGVTSSTLLFTGHHGMPYIIDPEWDRVDAILTSSSSMPAIEYRINGTKSELYIEYTGKRINTTFTSAYCFEDGVLIGYNPQRFNTWAVDPMCVNIPIISYSPFEDVSACCIDHTTCIPDIEYEKSLPTHTSDRECTPIKSCDLPSGIEKTAPTTTTDRECDNDISECGTYCSTTGCFFPSGTLGTNDCTQLQTCTYDSATVYFSHAFNSSLTYQSNTLVYQDETNHIYTTDRVCSTVTTCTRSQYESAPPTATTDRVCVDLTPCLYEIVSSSNNASVLQEHTEFYIEVPATATTDRICQFDNLNCFSDEYDANYYLRMNVSVHRDIQPYYYNTAQYVSRKCTKFTDCEEFSITGSKYVVLTGGSAISDVRCSIFMDCVDYPVSSDAQIDGLFWMITGCSFHSPCVNRRGMIQYNSALPIAEHTCTNITMPTEMASYIDENPDIEIFDVLRNNDYYFDIYTGSLLDVQKCRSGYRTVYLNAYTDVVCVRDLVCNRNQYKYGGKCLHLTAVNVSTEFILTDSTPSTDRTVVSKSTCTDTQVIDPNSNPNSAHEDIKCISKHTPDSSFLIQTSTIQPAVIQKLTCGPGEYFSPGTISVSGTPVHTYCQKCPMGTYQTSNNHTITECILHANMCPAGLKLKTDILSMASTVSSQDYCIKQACSPGYISTGNETGCTPIPCATYPRKMFWKQLDQSAATGMCVDCLECNYYIRECTEFNDAECGIPYDIDIIYPLCITLYIMYVLVAVAYYWFRSKEELQTESAESSSFA